MNRFYTPTTHPDEWKKLLAEPEKQWRTGFSAKALAYCWASIQDIPPEVCLLFSQSGIASFQQLELLLALPEHKVAMPPRNGHPSQNDLFVLARAGNGELISITIEGKVSEPFGQTLGGWKANPSPGKIERLEFLQTQLGLPGDLPLTLRYQLLHRTVSAIVEAHRFNAPNAAMIVHSFSQNDVWFNEYQQFVALFGVEVTQPGQLIFLKETNGVKLYSGWARGDEKFLQM
jgi:hypothetical protein